MNDKIKNYIDSLTPEQIPWDRMFTAEGTAENYDEILSDLENTADFAEFSDYLDEISSFETQGTLFPPAPFVLVFLVRILEKHLTDKNDDIAKALTDQLLYYAEICKDSENSEHAEPLDNFSDMLDEEHLLEEDIDDDELEELFEDPDIMPDDLFYSLYYYSNIVLSQIPEILDKYGKFDDISQKFKDIL